MTGAYCKGRAWRLEGTMSSNFLGTRMRRPMRVDIVAGLGGAGAGRGFSTGGSWIYARREASPYENAQTYLEDCLNIHPDLHILLHILPFRIIYGLPYLYPCSFASLVSCFEFHLTLPDARDTVLAAFFV